MAIRLTRASSQSLIRSSDLPDCNSAYTVMAQLYLPAVPVDIMTAIQLRIGFNDYDFYGFWSNGLLYIEQAGGSTPASTYGSAPSANTWMHFAGVRAASGASTLTAYINGVQDAQISVDPTGRGSIAELRAGALLDTTHCFDGRLYAIKIWTAALTVAEIELERHAIRPVRTANLYGWWPCLPGATERTRDYSGNGRHWTEVGSPTDEDSAPVSWGGTQLWVPVVSTAGVALTATIVSASSTPDTSAILVAREITATLSSTSTTPDTSTLLTVFLTTTIGSI